jgi:uncharacterized protein
VVTGRRALVVLDGDDVWEDMTAAADALCAILAADGWAARAVAGTGRFVAGPVPAELVVLYRADAGMTPAAADGLEAGVRGGLGLLGIHSAAYRAPAVLGAEFVGHGPDPQESLVAVGLDPAHPVTRGVAPFTVPHEHYELAVADDAETLAWRDAGGRREPILTARSVGAGRVSYLQLGHDMRTWDEPGVRALIARAAAWSVGSEVAA